MKILHLTISSEIGGGPEHISQLIQGVSDRYEAHVACPDVGDYYVKFLKLTSNRVTLIPHRKFSFIALYKLIRYIRYNHIELLHSHGKGAGFYCRLINIFVKIPSVHTPHGINKKIEKGFINQIYIHFERFFEFLITSIIFVSKSEAAYAKKLCIWDNVPFVVINNGTKIIPERDINNWRTKVRQDLNCINRKIVITASRFDFQKNTIEFCEIASKFPGFYFIILGDGIEKNKCEVFCAKHNIINILFAGNVSNPIQYFAASDLYLSTARWEGLSMAILEAMSVGLPVVATRVLGNIDLVEPLKTGFLYEIGNIDEAVNYIKTAFSSQFYINLSKKSKIIHNKRFSSTSMCELTMNLYDKILMK